MSDPMYVPGFADLFKSQNISYLGFASMRDLLIYYVIMHRLNHVLCDMPPQGPDFDLFSNKRWTGGCSHMLSH